MDIKRRIFKDEKFYQRVLDRCSQSLIVDLHPIPLLKEFLAEEILENSVVQDIQKLPSTSEKNKEILRILRGRGEQGYLELKCSLMATGQRHFVDTLLKAESELETITEMEQTQKRIEWSQRIPDEKDLMEIAGLIGMNWEYLGHSLGVPTTEIDQFKKDNPDNVKMQIFRMLLRWKQSSVSLPSMGRLHAILKCNVLVKKDLEKIGGILLGIANDPPNRRSGQQEQSYLQRTDMLYDRVNTRDQVVSPTGQEKVMLSVGDPSGKKNEMFPVPYRTFHNQPLTMYQRDLSSSLPENLNSALILNSIQYNQFGNTRRQGSNFSNIPGPDISHSANFLDGPVSPVPARNTGRDHVDAVRERSPQTEGHAGDARWTQLGPAHSASVPENMGSQKNYEKNDLSSMNMFIDKLTKGANKIAEFANEMTESANEIRNQMTARQPTLGSQVVQNKSSQQGPSVTVVTDSTDIVDSSAPSNSTDQTSLAPELQVAGELPKCPHDGRLLTWSVDIFKLIIKNSTKKVTKGGFGDVYLHKAKLRNLGIPVVVKEIDCKEDYSRHKMMSITNEKVASRTMHFAIVPLIAMSEDINTNIFYFLTPYLENGDLSDAISRDTKILQDASANEMTITLTKERRLKIIYQVNCALEYLHTPVQGYRGKIVHMDLKSTNIVLDGSFNARLIDFGLSREMNEASNSVSVTATEVPGSKGYASSNVPKKLTVEDDYHHFGVVIRELLTGQPPYNDETNKELKKTIEKKIQAIIQSLWFSSKTPSKEALELNKLATKCIKRTIKTTEVKNIIEDQLPNGINGKWKRRKSDDKCEMCIVNTAAKISMKILPHDENCTLPISVCVACIRNSYLNQIICHTCGEKLVPIIGNGWGALLIAGNDVSKKRVDDNSAVGKKTLADGFSDDITKVHQVLVSKCPLVMGIEECNAQVVKPTKPGSPETMMAKLDAAVNNLKENKTIHTLVIYFSGHHYPDKGFLLGNDGEFLKVERLQQVTCEIAQNYSAGGKMSRLISSRRFYIFLDCCIGPNMTTPPSPEAKKDDGNTDVKDVQRPDPPGDYERPSKTMVPKLKFSDKYCILQLNASSYTKGATGTNEGSAFTKYFVQALTQRALQTVCENGQNCEYCNELMEEFITVIDLHKYIHQHMTHFSSGEVIRNEDEAKLHDAIIAYNVDFPVALEFRVKDINEKETVPLQLYSEFEHLEHHLFGRLMAKLIQGIDHSLYTDFTKSLCIEIDRGPKVTEELNTIPKLMAAWNSRRDLAISLRSVENIHRGMVLILVPIEEIKLHLSGRKLEKKEEKSLERFILPFKELDGWVSDLSHLQRSENLTKFQDYLLDITECIELAEKVVAVDSEKTELHILFPKPVEGRQENFLCFDIQNLIRKV